MCHSQSSGVRGWKGSRLNVNAGELPPPSVAEPMNFSAGVLISVGLLRTQRVRTATFACLALARLLPGHSSWSVRALGLKPVLSPTQRPGT